MSLLRTQSAPLQQFDNGNGAGGAQQVEKSPLTAANNEQPFFRLDLLRSLQLHRRLALCIALAGVALAAAYVAMKWPIYIAQSQVYIQPVLPKIMNPGAPSHWPNDAATYDSFIEQQVHNSARPDVLLSVLHKLGPGGWQRGGESELAAAARLGTSVEVARMGATYQVGITARASDPEMAAKIANAMAESIVEKASSEEKAGDSERLGILRDEQQRIQKELDSDRNEQQVLNAKLGVAAIGATAPDHYDDDIGRIHEELVKARTAHDEAAARLMALGSNHEQAMNAEAEDQVIADPGLTSMKMALNQRRAVLITQMANLTPNHPQYKQDAEELAQINASLDSTLKDLRAKTSARIQQRLRTDLDRTAGVEGRLNAQLGQLAGAAASATPKMQRANDLATDILRLQTRLNVVDEQLHNLMLENNVPGAAHLSVTAMVPLHPTVSGIMRKALPMALGGILFGLLAALIAYNLDPKVYIAADVEHVLGYAPMAQLPNFNEVSEGLVEEHMLRLSATIDHARQQGKLKSFIFTGTGPGAGVTTLSTKIKKMLEIIGRPSTMVDASGTPLPIQRVSPGESAVQDGSSTVTGKRGSRSTALLQQVSAKTEKAESLVLTDAAPLSISAETEYLVRHVDAVIVVVESGVTTRAQLREVADALQRLDAKAVGFVLNRVRLQNADPAFRDTLRSMEKHLQAQGRSQAAQGYRPTRNLIPEEEELPAPVVAAQEPVPGPEIPHPASVEQSLPVPEKREQKALEHGASPDSLFELGRRISELHEKFVPAQTVSASKPVSGRRAVEEAVSSQPAKTPRDKEQSEPVEAQSESASRLNGLRAILFEQGLKNLNHNYENEPEVPLPDQAFSPIPRPSFRAPVEEARAPQAPPPPSPAVDVPKAVDLPKAVAFKAPPREVVAEPEFLPPREFIPVKGEEEEGNEKADAHHDRRDPYDELEILPSWHGQYRRKS